MNINWFLVAAALLNIGAAAQAWLQHKPAMVVTMLAYAVAALALAVA